MVVVLAMDMGLVKVWGDYSMDGGRTVVPTVIPAQAGIRRRDGNGLGFSLPFWIPAYAGRTVERAGMTVERRREGR